jgi:hypothetical protein
LATKGYDNYSGTQNIMGIKVVVRVFKLAPSSLTYAIILYSNSYQKNNSFNHTTMVSFNNFMNLKNFNNDMAHFPFFVDVITTNAKISKPLPYTCTNKKWQ